MRIKYKQVIASTPVTANQTIQSLPIDTQFGFGQSATISNVGSGSCLIYLQGSYDGVSWFLLPNEGSTYKKYLLSGETGCYNLSYQFLNYLRIEVEGITGTSTINAFLSTKGI
jgi:hypothetical protein